MAELRPLRDNTTHNTFAISRKPLAAGYSPLKSIPNAEDGADVTKDHQTEHARTRRWQRPQKGLRMSNPFGASWMHQAYISSWLFEIASLIISTIAFAATIITPAVHQHKPLPQWPRLISINSLIAIFTAVMKAALIMPVTEGLGQIKWNWFRNTRALVDPDRLDAATRGPWGSFLLIATWFTNYLALLGALITVVALAIDPFSQQVIEYRNCDQAVAGTAFISTSSNYSRVGGAESAARDLVDNDMQSAIYTALIATPADASSGVQIACQTGNCTSPGDGTATYMSLAMCGRCDDLTPTITKTTIPWTTSAVGGIPVDLKFTVPASYDPGVNNVSLSIYGSSNSSVMGSDTWLSLASDYLQPSNNWYIAAFHTIIWANCSCISPGESSLPPCICTPFAANCSIYPCVKTYNASIQKGVLYETEVPNAAVPEVPIANMSNYLLAVDETLRQGKRYPCSNSSSYSPDFPVGNQGTWSSANGWNYVWYPEGCLWQFDYMSVQSLNELFSKRLWNGILSATRGTRLPINSYGDPWLQTMLENGTANIDTMRTYIDGLTGLMTGVIRRNGATTPAMQVYGTATQNQTCIYVRWPWLSLPAALLIMTAIFLTAVIWTVSKGDATVWKSSPLALLFHGLDPEVNDEYSSLLELQSMKTTARSMRVRMEANEHGYRFAVK